MSSIEEVRNKIQHEFKTKEEYYKHIRKNGYRLSDEELYKDASESLLPIFKVAKEMCEHISGDKDYFKKNEWEQGYPFTRLYHMAIVSKVIQDINENCTTTKDKEKCIWRTKIYSDINHYYKDDKVIKAPSVLEREKIEDFMRVSSGWSFDDQYYRRYMSAVREDIKPEFSDNKNPCCSVSGNILSWDNMKNSNVLCAVAEHFVAEEMWRLQRERKQSKSEVKLSEQEKREEHFKIYKQAEQSIQAKINEFCDMKQAQFMKQMQKSNTEVKG